MNNKIKATLSVTNVLNGKSFNRAFLCIGEKQALKFAELSYKQNPDCVIIVSSLEGQFFHVFPPVNMDKDLTLVEEGKMEFDDYFEKWVGAQKPKKARKEKPKRASDSEMFCQSAA
jgi:hypothetical protein